MHRSPTTRPRSLPRLLALAITLACLGGWPMPVAAHAELLQSTPTPNATLAEAPGEVTIAFSEPIDADNAFLDLIDSSQRRVDGIGPASVEADGRVVRSELPPLEPGIYTVSYQVVSTVDGHATTGSFAFRIDPTGAAAPPTTPATATSPSVDGLTIAARWIALASLLVALGSILSWWQLRRPTLELGGPPWRLVGAAALSAAVGVAAYLWLAGRPIIGDVADGLLPVWLDPAAPFGLSPFAVAMRLSLLAALAVGATALLGGRWSERARVVATAVLLAMALAGMSVAGHAASYGGPAFAVIDWLHLLAVAAWLGALPAVLLVARRHPSHGRTVLRRHGRVAMVAAPLVALTGIANSPLVLGASRDLVSSDYGNLLVAKASLLAVALGIGAVNHLTLRGRGRSATAALLAVELVVAAVAVSAAATMVTIQPASARPSVLTAPPVNPAHLFGEVGGTSLHATVNPPAVGSQAIQVSLTDADTGLPADDVESVMVELSPPAGSEAEVRSVELAPADDVPGLFGISGAFTSEVGDWTLEIAVRRDGADARFVFAIPVSRREPAEPVPPPDTGIDAPAPLAAVWSVLPPGLLGWLPAAVGLAAILLSWRLGPSSLRTGARVTLAGLVVVAGIGAATRSIVDAANAPVAALLDAPPPAPASVEQGEGIYLANCASCHGRDGLGDGPLVTVPAPGSLAEAVRDTGAAQLSYRIAYGVAGTPMPAFAGRLTRDVRWALGAYLRSRWAEP